MKFFKKKLDIIQINFEKFWKKTQKSKLPKELIDITDKFIISDSYKNVSKYWHSLNIKNYNQLIELGINNYATNIALNYYTFLHFDNHLIRNTFQNVRNKKINYKLDLFKKHHLLKFDSCGSPDSKTQVTMETLTF